MNNTPEDGAWTLELLLEAEAADHRLKFVHFWGHTKPASGELGPHVFSQWYPHDFTVGDITYATAEHYMMAEKARLFSDEEAFAEILAAKSPAEAKNAGRRVRGFNNAVWDEHRLDIVSTGSFAKFDSNDALRSYLLGTGSRVLVEASPVDPIWGVGLSRDDSSVERPSEWRGLNLLGFALMNARAKLRRASEL